MQGLDIFKKDFLFVPIHDHLHWSLLIVCNPGADPDDPTRTPCMLHLDSMTGMPCSLSMPLAQHDIYLQFTRSMCFCEPHETLELAKRCVGQQMQVSK
jgi:Ulp1 family protease